MYIEVNLFIQKINYIITAAVASKIAYLIEEASSFSLILVV